MIIALKEQSSNKSLTDATSLLSDAMARQNEVLDTSFSIFENKLIASSAPT